MFCSSNLLPQAPETYLIEPKSKLAMLARLAFILKVYLLAIADYASENFSQFDPHVGENACQVRAYYLYVLRAKRYKMEQELDDYKRIISEKLTLINALSLKLKSEHPKRHVVQLGTFLKENALDFKLPKDVMFLGLSYFISLYGIRTDTGILMGINYQKLASNLGESKSFTNNLIRHYQSILAELTCQFMFGLRQDFPLQQKQFELLSKLTREGEIRKMLPSYGGTEVLLEHMLLYNVPICIILDYEVSGKYCRQPYVFSPTATHEDFQLKSLSDFKPSDAFIVILGTSSFYKTTSHSYQSWIEAISGLGLKNILLANMAKHPQYSGALLKQLRDNPFAHISQAELSSPEWQSYIARFNQYKNSATAMGCTIENDSIFLLKHVYCDKLEHILSINFSH